jgi:N-acetylglucosamine malate deacetylase 1
VILPNDLTVLAAVAHPDDIEFYFAGTLLLLREAGCSIHMWNLADGCCGTMTHGRKEISGIRAEEARASAALAGAQIHPPLFHDLEIFYDRPSLLSVSAVVRSIRPHVILTHSPVDYMEDHQNVCRLVVTAAFSHAIPNFITVPEVPPYSHPVRVYHAPPHGLQDALEAPIRSDFLIDIATTMEAKKRMLGCHKSQQDWLASTQGMQVHVQEMERLCAEMGARGAGLTYAEAWRRHSHLGFCPPDFNPVPEILQAFSQKPKP